MATDIGINFRATSGFVMDEAGETYCLGSDEYPTPRGGGNFGWATGPVPDRDRDSGIDRRLAGINQRANGVAAEIFRLDLDTATDHNVVLAAGDTAGSQKQDVEFGDAGSYTTVGDNVSTSSNNYMEADGSVTAEADFPDATAVLTKTFTTQIFNVRITNLSALSFSTTLAHLKVTEVGGGGPTIGLARMIFLTGDI